MGNIEIHRPAEILPFHDLVIRHQFPSLVSKFTAVVEFQLVKTGRSGNAVILEQELCCFFVIDITLHIKPVIEHVQLNSNVP